MVIFNLQPSTPSRGATLTAREHAVGARAGTGLGRTVRQCYRFCMFGSVWGEVREMTPWTTVATPFWIKLFCLSYFFESCASHRSSAPRTASPRRTPPCFALALRFNYPATTQVRTTAREPCARPALAHAYRPAARSPPPPPAARRAPPAARRACCPSVLLAPPPPGVIRGGVIRVRLMPPDAGDSVGTGPRRVGTKTLSHEICRAFCFAFSCTGVVLDPHPAAALLRMLQPAYQPAHGMRMSHTDATTNSRTPPLLLCYAYMYM